MGLEQARTRSDSVAWCVIRNCPARIHASSPTAGRVSDIVEVVGTRVRSSARARDTRSACRFTTSARRRSTVSQTKQFYHCFAAGRMVTRSRPDELRPPRVLDAVDANVAAAAGMGVARDARQRSDTPTAASCTRRSTRSAQFFQRRSRPARTPAPT
jgi:hypothetical protein